MPEKFIRIAILDDGVHPQACPLAGSFLIDDDLKVTTIKKADASPGSHGSMCARIVGRYAGWNDISVFSIQILQGDTRRGNIGRLLSALELCVSLDIRLIHLSVGTYAYEDFARLEKAVGSLLDSGRLMVAAAGNRGTVTYPAYLPGVIGVKCHPGLVDDEYIYCYDSFSRIHFQASAMHRLVIEGQEMETSVSNSYAAPLITAKVLSYLKEYPGLGREEILHMLEEDATGGKLPAYGGVKAYPVVEIPVVVLGGFPAGRLSGLVGFLKGCLQQDDYDVRTATDLPGGRPWEETAMPVSVDLDIFSARMAWYFSCEIILLGVVSYIIPSNRYRNVSLWIYGDRGGECSEGDAVADGQVLQAAGLSDAEIYQSMLALLT